MEELDQRIRALRSALDGETTEVGTQPLHAVTPTPEVAMSEDEHWPAHAARGPLFDNLPPAPVLDIGINPGKGQRAPRHAAH